MDRIFVKMIIVKMILKYLIILLTNLKEIGVATAFFVKIKASAKLGFWLSLVFVPVYKLTMSYWDVTKPLFFFAVKPVEEIFNNALIQDMFLWYFDNVSYITIVGFAIIIDHALGTWKHLSKRDFSIKRNITGLMTKVGLVVACGILFEGLNIIIEKDTFVKEYLTIVTRLIVFLYPAGSAFGNSTFLSNGKFPPQSWLDKLKMFQKNLSPEELGKNNEE